MNVNLLQVDFILYLISITLHFLLQYNAVCAESNAIMSAFRAHADLRSSILYVTSPLCSDCAKIAVQSGVKTVIYSPLISGEQDKDEQQAVKALFDRARIPYL